MFVLKEKVIYQSKAQRILLTINQWFLRLPRLFKINILKQPRLETASFIPVLGSNGSYLRLIYKAKNDYKVVLNPIGEISGNYDVLIKMDDKTPEVLELVVKGIRRSSKTSTKINTAQFQPVFKQMRKKYPIKAEVFQQKVNYQHHTAQQLQTFKKQELKEPQIIAFNQAVSIQLQADADLSIDTALNPIQFKEQLKPIDLTKTINL